MAYYLSFNLSRKYDPQPELLDFILPLKAIREAAETNQPCLIKVERFLTTGCLEDVELTQHGKIPSGPPKEWLSGCQVIAERVFADSWKTTTVKLVEPRLSSKRDPYLLYEEEGLAEEWWEEGVKVPTDLLCDRELVDAHARLLSGELEFFYCELSAVWKRDVILKSVTEYAGVITQKQINLAKQVEEDFRKEQEHDQRRAERIKKKWGKKGKSKAKAPTAAYKRINKALEIAQKLGVGGNLIEQAQIAEELGEWMQTEPEQGWLHNVTLKRVLDHLVQAGELTPVSSSRGRASYRLVRASPTLFENNPS